MWCSAHPKSEEKIFAFPTWYLASSRVLKGQLKGLFGPILGGSWALMRRVRSMGTMVSTVFFGVLLTLLVSAHEPPSRDLHVP